MSNKKIEPKMISYAGVHLVIDTIAGFYPTHTPIGADNDDFGIVFVLRSGENVEAMGDSRALRDRVIEYLEIRIPTVEFPALKCEACKNYKEDEEKGGCYYSHIRGSRADCDSYYKNPMFEALPEEECTTILSE